MPTAIAQNWVLLGFYCTILVYLSTMEVPWVVEGLSLYMGEKGLMLFENRYLFFCIFHTCRRFTSF